MVQNQNPPLIEGLTDDQIMVIYQDGEMAGMQGRSVLASPYLDQPRLLSIWMMGYLDQDPAGLKPGSIEKSPAELRKRL